MTGTSQTLAQRQQAFWDALRDPAPAPGPADGDPAPVPVAVEGRVARLDVDGTFQIDRPRDPLARPCYTVATDGAEALASLDLSIGETVLVDLVARTDPTTGRAVYPLRWSLAAPPARPASRPDRAPAAGLGRADVRRSCPGAGRWSLRRKHDWEAHENPDGPLLTVTCSRCFAVVSARTVASGPRAGSGQAR